MIFRVVFAYAVARGAIDALTGRPHLQYRIAKVMLARAQRQMKEAMKEATRQVRAVQADMTKAVLEMAVAYRAIERSKRSLKWARFARCWVR